MLWFNLIKVVKNCYQLESPKFHKEAVRALWKKKKTQADEETKQT